VAFDGATVGSLATVAAVIQDQTIFGPTDTFLFLIGDLAEI
jgi:hypothetical protein